MPHTEAAAMIVTARLVAAAFPLLAATTPTPYRHV
jgi:hypothetical protein